MNYQYALLCVDDDVREQIEKAVLGLLQEHMGAAMSMAVNLKTWTEDSAARA